MITSELLSLPRESMEARTARALKEASERGTPVRFEYDNQIFQAEPAPDGMGMVQLIGDRRPRFPSPDEESLLYIGTCCEVMPKGWKTVQIVAAAANDGDREILVAGSSATWIRVMYSDIRLALTAGKGIDTVQKNNSVVLRNGSRIQFFLYENWERTRGCKFHFGFSEDFQEGFMGGNYNEFPYRSTTRERERYLRKAENEAQRQDRQAEMMAIAQLRMQALADKAAEELAAEQSKLVVMKPRSLGASQAGYDMIQRQLVDPGPQTPLYLLGEVEEMMMNRLADEVFRPSPIFQRLRQKMQMSAEDKLAVVRDTLLAHFKFQLSQAPSSAAVYANDVTMITAGDIARLVGILEDDSLPADSGLRWDRSDPMGFPEAGFAAESADGNKIVIENRFQAGVIFDPSNRPIRKFRLKEEAVSE